jgi:hypothetical protein
VLRSAKTARVGSKSSRVGAGKQLGKTGGLTGKGTAQPANVLALETLMEEDVVPDSEPNDNDDK